MALSRNSRDNDRGRSSSGFKLQERSYDDVKRHAERTGGRYDMPIKQDYDILKPRPGDNTLRILPATWDDAKHFGFSAWFHPFVGPERSTYACPRKNLGKRCPICEAADAARKEGDGDEAQALSAQEKYLYWVIDRDADKPEIPYVWMVSWSMDRDITSHSIDKRNNSFLQIEHDEAGYDLFITRIGTGRNTKYSGTQFDRQSTPIFDDPDMQDEVLDFVWKNPLPDTINYYDEKYLETVVAGTTVERDDLDEPNPAEREQRTSRRDRRDDRGDGGQARSRSGDSGRARGREDGEGQERSTRRERDERGPRRRGEEPGDGEGGEETGTVGSRARGSGEARGRRSDSGRGEDTRGGRGRSRDTEQEPEDSEEEQEEGQEEEAEEEGEEQEEVNERDRPTGRSRGSREREPASRRGRTEEERPTRGRNSREDTTEDRPSSRQSRTSRGGERERDRGTEDRAASSRRSGDTTREDRGSRQSTTRERVRVRR